MQEPINEKLCGRIRDPDGLEYLIEIVRNETVPRPLREKCQCDDNAHSPAVTRTGDERFPAHSRGNFAVKLECCSHLFKLMLDERVISIILGQSLVYPQLKKHLLFSISVIVCKCLQRLLPAAL